MALRTDDLDLGDEELLLRRILDKPAEWFTIKDGDVRVSSAAFKESTRELSVNVLSETTIEEVSHEHESDGIAQFLARIPRELKHIISKTLDDDDPPEPFHRVVCPPAGCGTKQYRKDAKAIARAAEWVLHPASAREAATAAE